MQPDTPVRRLPLPDQRGWPERFGDGRTERDAVLRLAHMGSVSPGNLRALAWREGSARRCIRAARRGVVGAADIERLDGVDPGAVRAALARLGARFVLPGEPEFPPQLLDLADPPGWLFVRGRPLHELGSTAVAVVGARNCSLYGREAAEWIGGGLASAGVVVVSGAARGIDAASHRGALAAGGPTVAVLGSGIDRPYPAAHRALLDGVAAAGTVVSEYPPGTPASKPRFPARNRIVAALARAVVVVEGAPGSGSMISAEFATQLGREVLAVPGPVTSPLSAIPHDLLREGAGLVRSPSDILEAVHGPGAAPMPVLGRLPGDERLVFDCLTGAAVTAEVVSAASGLPSSRALAALMRLELRGLVRAVGGRYQRTVAATGAR